MSDQTPYYPNDPSYQQQGNSGGFYQYPPSQPQPNTNYASSYGYSPSQPYPPPPQPYPPPQAYPPNYAVVQPMIPVVPMMQVQMQMQPVLMPGGNGPAVTSLVMGIIGVVLCWVWYIGVPVSIIGLIFGAVGMRRQTTGRGMAIAGLVLSIIGAAIGLCTLAFAAALLSSLFHYGSYYR